MRELMLICISLLMACGTLLIYGRAVGIPSGEEIVTIPVFLAVTTVFLMPTSLGYLVGRLMK